jgi:hypothetical protein
LSFDVAGGYHLRVDVFSEDRFLFDSF